MQRAGLVGLIAVANGVVAIATDYSDFEPRAFVPLATATVVSDLGVWERTSASGSEELAAMRSGYFGFVRDQKDDG